MSEHDDNIENNNPASDTEVGEQESVQLDESAATSPGMIAKFFAILFAPFRWLGRLWRKISFRMLLFRTIVYGLTGFALLFAIAVGLVKVFVEPDDIKTQLKAFVEEQTGGRLDIGAVNFSVLSGIKLENVQFYAPEHGDLRGHLNGGAVSPIPLANFVALDVQYNVTRVFAGRLHLNALKLVAPEIHLRQVDDKFNFESIMAYREHHFSEPETTEISEEKVEEETKSEDALFNPAILFLPFEVMANNMGIEGLRFDLIVEKAGQIDQIVVTNGLSFNAGVNWHGLDSSLRFAMLSPFERPLELDIKQQSKDSNQIGLEQTLFVKMALNLALELQDLKRINFDFATRTMSLKTPIASFSDIGTFVQARIDAQDSYRGLDIETIKVDLGNAIGTSLKGSVSSPDNLFKVFDLKLKMNNSIVLKEIAALAAPFVSGFDANGEIEVSELSIEGQLDPEGILKPVDPKPLPYISGSIWLNEVEASLAGSGLEMNPVAGNISLAAGPALGSKGSQMDLSTDISIPKVFVNQTLDIGKVTAGVENLAIKMTTRFLWPEMIAPILKVNIESESVKASGDKLSPIDVPLFIDIDGNGREDLQRMGLNSSIEFGNLLDMSNSLDCQSRCQRFRLNNVIRLDSLQNLHSVIYPLGATLGLIDLIPSELNGAIDVQFNARGKIPDPVTTPPEEILKNGDVKFNFQTNVSRLNTRVPIKDVVLQNMDAKLLLTGNLARQKVEVNNSFDKLQLNLAPKGEKPDLVEVERFSFDTVVDNEIDGPIELPAILRQLDTKIVEKLYIGKVAVGALPDALSDLQFDTRMSQIGAESINLQHVKIKVPDFGVRVDASGDINLTPEFMPGKFALNAKTVVDHSGSEKLPAGIKTSGKMTMTTNVGSNDMKFLLLDGGVEFENFDVLIAEKGKDPVLDLQGMNGQIPLKQNVYIEQFLTKPAEEEVKIVEDANQPKSDEKKQVNDFIASLQTEENVSGNDSLADVYEKITPSSVGKNEDNVVAIVDYQSIRPFFPQKRPLGIRKLVAANLELSRMEFDIELRQNWFALNQFVINFLGGKIQGDFQVSFEPDFARDPMKMLNSFKTSLHLTRLDSTKLIERFPDLQKSGSINFLSDPYIDGTIHFKFSPQTNDMSGGIEITSIGKEQLKMILSYVDPYQKNPTISDIRSALTWGEVKHVSIPIKNGEIDMDVGIVVLKAPIPTPKLTRFPIGQMIDNFMSQMKSNKETQSNDPQSPKS